MENLTEHESLMMKGNLARIDLIKNQLSNKNEKIGVESISESKGNFNNA